MYRTGSRETYSSPRGRIDRIDRIGPSFSSRLSILSELTDEDFENDGTGQKPEDMFNEFVRGLGWPVDRAGQIETGNFLGCLHDKRLRNAIDASYYSASATEEVLIHVVPDADSVEDASTAEARKVLLSECPIHIVWNESQAQFQPETSGSPSSPSTRYDRLAIVISPIDIVEHSRHLLRVQIMSLSCAAGAAFAPPVIGPLIHGTIVPFNILSDSVLETCMNIAAVAKEPMAAAAKRQSIIDAIVRDVGEAQDTSLMLQNLFSLDQP